MREIPREVIEPREAEPMVIEVIGRSKISIRTNFLNISKFTQVV